MPFRAKFLILVLGALALPAAAVAAAPQVSGIAVIVAAGATAPKLTRDQLAPIFERKKLFWDDGQRIHPVNLSAGHPLRRAFSAQVFGRAPEDLDEYWRDMYFHGVLPPFVLASEEAVIRFVVNTPGAIGYVSACLADRRVVVLLRVDNAMTCTR